MCIPNKVKRPYGFSLYYATVCPECDAIVQPEITPQFTYEIPPEVRRTLELLKIESLIGTNEEVDTQRLRDYVPRLKSALAVARTSYDAAREDSRLYVVIKILEKILADLEREPFRGSLVIGPILPAS